MSNWPAVTINRRVQQVAALVHLLDEREIAGLLKLAPRLRRTNGGRKTDARADLVQWAREEMAQYAAQAPPMRRDDPFLAGLTVAEYFALPDRERERIWDELYTEAIQICQEQEAPANAIVPARQEHRP